MRAAQESRQGRAGLMLGKKAVGEVTRVDRMARWQALLLAYGLMIPLVIADHYVNPDINLAMFYLAPVMIAAWRGSLAAGILLSLIAAVAREIANQVEHGHVSSPWINLLNLTSRIVIYVLVTLLVHRRRQAMKQLIRLSRVDPLTGLLNRRAFHEAVEEELLRQKRTGGWVSLAYLDVDHFKQINDTLGHQAGDKALVAVAKVLRGRLRRTDVVGRLGGDEFAVLMPETDSQGAHAMISPLKEMLVAALEKEKFRVSFSIGVISCNTCAETKRLLREADVLMYEVKRNGRGDLRQRELAA